MMIRWLTDLFDVKHQKKFNNTHGWHEGAKEGSNPAIIMISN